MQPQKLIPAVSSEEIKADMYNRLFTAIVDGRLDPGDKIQEAELSALYNVSRTVIREVLLHLHHDGLVALPLNRGSFVATPARTDAIQLVRIAALLVADVATLMASARLAARNRALRANATLMAIIVRGDDEAPAYLDLLGVMAAETGGQLMVRKLRAAAAAAWLAMRANRCERTLLPLAESLQSAIRDGDSDKARAAVQSYYGAIIARLEKPPKAGLLRNAEDRATL